jgi:uncharacterized protein YciI
VRATSVTPTGARTIRDEAEVPLLLSAHEHLHPQADRSRPTFAVDMTDDERDVMGRHAGHWQSFIESGQMVVFGPVLDATDHGASASCETDDEDALRAHAAGDPAVTTGTAQFEIGKLLTGFVRPPLNLVEASSGPGPKGRACCGDGRLELDALAHPIVQAPMGGGPSTPALAPRVSSAGGARLPRRGLQASGSRARGPRGAASLLVDEAPFGGERLRAARARSRRRHVAAYAETLSREASASGVALGPPRWDDDRYAEKLDLLCDETYRWSRSRSAALARGRRAPPSRQVAVWVTVTTPDEAGAAAPPVRTPSWCRVSRRAGTEGSFDDGAPGDVGLLALLQLVARGSATRSRSSPPAG